MKVIFAQGNPGIDYARTRHNVGWQVLNAWAQAQGVSFHEKSKFQSEIGEVGVGGEKVLLVKPLTFYNDTGSAARALVDFYKLDPAHDLLVIHDDLVLPLGTLRIREKGRDAGNNGIKSLNAALGQEYFRIRVGIGTSQRGLIGDFDFVLGKFTQDEQAILDKYVISKCGELIEEFCRGQLPITSHDLAPPPAPAEDE